LHWNKEIKHQIKGYLQYSYKVDYGVINHNKQWSF